MIFVEHLPVVPEVTTPTSWSTGGSPPLLLLPPSSSSSRAIAGAGQVVFLYKWGIVVPG